MNGTAKPAMTLPPVGSRVKLTNDGPRWWDVRAADERFAILTRQAEFHRNRVPLDLGQVKA